MRPPYRMRPACGGLDSSPTSFSSHSRNVRVIVRYKRWIIVVIELVGAIPAAVLYKAALAGAQQPCVAD